MSGLIETIVIDGFTVIEAEKGREPGSSMEVTVDTNLGILDDNSELPRYMIYLMGGIVLLLILIFVIWYVARKRMMIRVRAKI